MQIDVMIDEAFKPIADMVSGIVFFTVPTGFGTEVAVILLWLLAAALFFSFYLGFVNFRYFFHAFSILSGKYDTKGQNGQISRFQALTTSLSGTVGLGNIAGVALAVSIGGPGAVFWMVLMGLFSMSTKFVEVVLAVKYRRHNDPQHPEEISGGPMYYLREAFERRNIRYVGPALAALYAICCIGASIGGGNMFQANQAYRQMVNATGGDLSFFADKGWLFGIGLALMVGIVIIGGIKPIASVASRLVPAMAVIYLLAGLTVIAIFYQQIPHALTVMFTQAFALEAGIGALLGSVFIGIQRAAFSNEAGLGSAAIVHSAAKCEDPITQGFVGMLGPFFDTVVICLVTALVIVVTGAYENNTGVSGVTLTSDAMAMGVSWFPYVLTLTVFLFAYSTLITWSYYGVKSVTYLFGHRDKYVLAYKIIFCSFIVIGSAADLNNIVAFTDAMILCIAFPNIVGLYLCAPEIRRDLKTYAEKLRLLRQGGVHATAP